MKRMLDELKKLDEEYPVPADFKGKVMNRIREINNLEKRESKAKHFTKYVVPCLASVAVVLIVCIVTINGGFTSKSTDSLANQSATMDVAISGVNGMAEYEGNINNVEYAIDDNLNQKDYTIPTAEGKETEKVVMNDMASADSIVMEEVRETLTANKAEMAKEIVDILIKENIEIIEESEKYIIVSANFETINELLKDVGDVTILVVENGIKIEF